MDRDEFVLGKIKLPFLRWLGTQIAYPLMKLGIPGAAWWYFRCLFGPGVSFDVHKIDL